MTQAYNLSQLANFINSSGKLSNSGLQNQSITVSAGTGLSGGGSVNLGGSVSLNNTGVLSVAGSGSGISVSTSSGAVTVSNTGVTSLNGNTGSITTGLIVAWVNFNGVPSSPTIRASYNVGSVTKSATGVYLINFTSALPDANYAATFGASPQNGRWLINYYNGLPFNNSTTPITNSTTQFGVACTDYGGTFVDCTNGYVAFFR